MARTHRRARASFGTLTYPGEWPPDRRVWKRHLDSFLKRLARAHSDVCGFWKLEFQKRGAPHFHLMMFGAPGRETQGAYVTFRQWIAENWYEVVASGDERHLYAGTEFDEVYSPQGAISYTAKYMAKDSLPESVQGAHLGRWWGCFNRRLVPFVAEIRIELQKHEAQFLLRTVRRFVCRLSQDKRGRFRRRRSRASNGMVLLCEATTWAHQLEALVNLANASHVPAENRPF